MIDSHPVLRSYTIASMYRFIEPPNNHKRGSRDSYARSNAKSRYFSCLVSAEMKAEAKDFRTLTYITPYNGYNFNVIGPNDRIDGRYKALHGYPYCERADTDVDWTKNILRQ